MGPNTQSPFPLWRWPLLLLLALLAGASSSGAKPASDRDRQAADQLFATTNFPLLKIEIGPDGVKSLKSTEWQKEERPAVACTLREGDAVYTNVTVHLKGSAGSFQPIDLKPGLTLNFNKNAKGQRFHGLEKISLNNSAQDPAFINDKLARELYTAAGVPAPRATYARVQLNGRELGLFLLTEPWDKQFLARHFKNPNGNFYERRLSNNLDSKAIPKFGQDPEDRSHLAALLAAAREKDLSKRFAALGKTLDLDRFVTLLALDAMTWNWDGFMLNNNNYRFYHDPEQNRMVFLPHGMDQMFWRAEGPLMPGSKTAVARAALEIPEFRRRYLERVAQLWGSVFQVGPLTNRVQELGRQILPVLRASGDKAAADYPDHLQLVQDRITRRGLSLVRQMAGVKELLQFEGSQPQKVSSWSLVSKIGEKLPDNNISPAKHLEIEGKEALNKLWGSTLWLEGGTYRVEGLAKTEGLLPETQSAASNTNFPTRGAGFRVWSRHKFTEGSSWGWFPYAESRNLKQRGLLPPRKGSGLGLSGDTEWQRIAYDFELRQPLAELTLFFELRESNGQAALQRDSVTITRLKD
jgi:hypothetical protein